MLCVYRFHLYNVLGIQIFLVNVEKLWKDRELFFFFFPPRSEAMTRGFRTFYVKNLPTSLIQISSRCKSLSAGQGVSGVTRSPGLPCQEGLSRGSRLPSLSVFVVIMKSCWKRVSHWDGCKVRYFVLIGGGGVWSHQHETQHTPAGCRGGAAASCWWRLGSCSAPPCFMRTWPPFIYAHLDRVTYISTYMFTYISNVHWDIYIASSGIYVFIHTHIYFPHIYIAPFSL